MLLSKNIYLLFLLQFKNIHYFVGVFGVDSIGEKTSFRALHLKDMLSFLDKDHCILAICNWWKKMCLMAATWLSFWKKNELSEIHSNTASYPIHFCWKFFFSHSSPHSSTCNPCLLGNAVGYDMSISVNLRGITDIEIHIVFPVGTLIDCDMNITISNIYLMQCYNCSELYWIILQLLKYVAIKCC